MPHPPYLTSMIDVVKATRAYATSKIQGHISKRVVAKLIIKSQHKPQSNPTLQQKEYLGHRIDVRA